MYFKFRLLKKLHLTFPVLLLGMIFIIQSCCITKPPEQVAGVLVVFEEIFDEDHFKAWVIETEQGNPDNIIDSVYYGALHHVTEFSFFLEFRKTGENGDYYIFAGPGTNANEIKEMKLWTDSDKCGNEEIFYNYKFNGFLQTHKNERINIYRSQL